MGQRGGVTGFALWHFCCFVLFFGLFFLCPGFDECQADENASNVISAHVVRVVDGDSLEVKSKGKKLRVRLWGIDTPEWQQGFSQEAKAFSQRRVQGRQVELKIKDCDKYGRLVVMVEVDGERLNESLLREGLAWVHIYYCKEPICQQWRQLEKQARMARRGLWQEEEPVPPWKWKQGHQAHR